MILRHEILPARLNSRSGGKDGGQVGAEQLSGGDDEIVRG